MVDRSLSMSARSDERPRVAVQERQPVAEIGGVVLTRRLAEFELSAPERRAQLCDELLGSVGMVAEPAREVTPEPVGVPLAEPLDPGRPVFRRPAAVVGMLIPLVVVGAIVALVLAVTGTRRIDELAAGDCLDLPVGRTIERADPIDCDDPHNAEVTGVIAAGKVPSLGDLCARQTTAYLGSDEGVDGLQPAAIRYGVDGKTSVICLVTSDDGSRFSGSRRGAGR